MYRKDLSSLEFIKEVFQQEDYSAGLFLSREEDQQRALFITIVHIN